MGPICPASGAPKALVLALTGLFRQFLCELRRITLPRTPLNKGRKKNRSYNDAPVLSVVRPASVGDGEFRGGCAFPGVEDEPVVVGGVGEQDAVVGGGCVKPPLHH